MDEESTKSERNLIEICDKSNHMESTNRIRAKKSTDYVLENKSVNYFLNSLEPEDRILLKRFIHRDTHCYGTNISPSYWRVQGYMCVGDILDYLQEIEGQNNRCEKLNMILENIEFDKWLSTEDYLNCKFENGEMIVVEYNGLTYVKVLEYKALHRIL